MNDLYLDDMVEEFIKDMERGSRTMEQDLKEVKTKIEKIVCNYDIKDIKVFIDDGINGRSVTLQIEV